MDIDKKIEIRRYVVKPGGREFRYCYNTVRPHRSLWQTPAEVYNEFHRLLFYKLEKKKQLLNLHTVLKANILIIARRLSQN